MHRFFAEDRENSITGEEHAHLTRVLRLGQGDIVEVLQAGRRMRARLGQVEKSRAWFEPMEELPANEARCRVTLYQGAAKGEKMDFIVQKCTEMGVHAIVPVYMERSVVRPERDEKKTERYRRIAREAVKQCGRSAVPEIGAGMPFAQALARMKAHETLLMPYENGGAALSQPIASRDVAILIGPEGGIADGEAEQMRKMGARICTLGDRILRTETAGLVVLTLALHCAGDLGGAN